MHLPDGFLSAPVCVVTTLGAVAAVGFALRQAQQELGERLVPLLGVTSAGLFAAQMVNFPVLPGVSGHLLGGVLAASLLGPWGGLVSLSLVLVAQLLFGDGGVTTLGANILNMGLLGAVGGGLIAEALQQLWPGPRGRVAATTIAAWFGVQLAAVGATLQLSLSGVMQVDRLWPLMLLVHAVIGLGEAILTGLVVGYIVRVRPDVLYTPAMPLGRLARTGQVIGAGLAVAVVVACFAAPWASAAPDGLNAVAEQLQFAQREQPWVQGWIPGYQWPGLGEVWYATSLAGLTGVAVVFVAGWLLGRGLERASNRL